MTQKESKPSLLAKHCKVKTVIVLVANDFTCILSGIVELNFDAPKKIRSRQKLIFTETLADLFHFQCSKWLSSAQQSLISLRVP
jgi:hypothetical protein